MQRLAVIIVLGLALVAGCADGTRLRVDVAVDPALAIDSYQVKVEDHVVLSEPRPTLELLLADATAGSTMLVEVWGLRAGTQVAYGAVPVVPAKGETVAAAVTLAPISCGTWCTPGTIACASDGYTTCEQQDDGCLAWSDVTACPSATPFCSNGACAAQCEDECGAGDTACDSASAVRTCGRTDQNV